MEQRSSDNGRHVNFDYDLALAAVSRSINRSMKKTYSRKAFIRIRQEREEALGQVEAILLSDTDIEHSSGGTPAQRSININYFVRRALRVITFPELEPIGVSYYGDGEAAPVFSDYILESDRDKLHRIIDRTTQSGELEASVSRLPSEQLIGDHLLSA